MTSQETIANARNRLDTIRHGLKVWRQRECDGQEITEAMRVSIERLSETEAEILQNVPELLGEAKARLRELEYWGSKRPGSRRCRCMSCALSEHLRHVIGRALVRLPKLFPKSVALDIVAEAYSIAFRTQTFEGSRAAWALIQEVYATSAYRAS